MTTGVYFHPKFFGKNWPIVGDRYTGFSRILQELVEEVNQVELLEPSPVSEDLLLSTHTKQYLEKEKRSWYFEGAKLTVGGCVEASRKVWKNQLDNAVCFLAAAGHHAHPDYAWGGTYLSCIGPILAALDEEGFSKLVYIDTDSHHGDGSREILLNRADTLHVCFCSSDTEEGENNLCLNVGRETTDEKYLKKVKGILPRIRDFNPGIIVHFFGHDTHKNDYGNRGLSTEFFPKLAKTINNFSLKNCDGKYVVIDGGGANAEVGRKIWPEIIKILATCKS